MWTGQEGDREKGWTEREAPEGRSSEGGHKGGEGGAYRLITLHCGAENRLVVVSELSAALLLLLPGALLNEVSIGPEAVEAPEKEGEGMRCAQGWELCSALLLPCSAPHPLPCAAAVVVKVPCLIAEGAGRSSGTGSGWMRAQAAGAGAAGPRLSSRTSCWRSRCVRGRTAPGPGGLPPPPASLPAPTSEPREDTRVCLSEMMMRPSGSGCWTRLDGGRGRGEGRVTSEETEKSVVVGGDERRRCAPPWVLCL